VTVPLRHNDDWLRFGAISLAYNSVLDAYPTWKLFYRLSTVVVGFAQYSIELEVQGPRCEASP
jgi:hypothetical protein